MLESMAWISVMWTAAHLYIEYQTCAMKSNVNVNLYNKTLC